MTNKKIGNDFERDFCDLLFSNGFWAHNMAQNQAGQPADVIAARNGKAYLIDCKVCSVKGFALDRMEENQDLSMSLWKERGNGEGWFAILLEEQIYMLPHIVVEAYRRLSSYLSPKEIREIGKTVEVWMKKCK